MSDDRIIHLPDYRRERRSAEGAGETSLALLGTQGERRRYVLPLWRMAYVAEARWAALVEHREGRLPEPAVVLDLRADPARPVPEGGLPALRADDIPPRVRVATGNLLLPLTVPRPEVGGWYVLVADRADESPPGHELREDLLFLAGECAGLVALLEDADED